MPKNDKTIKVKVLKFEGKREVRKVKNLIPYEFNNKDHPEKQIDLLANAISDEGYIDEISINEKGIIIAWHGRLESIKKMWYDEVEVKVLDPKNEKKLRLTMNRLAELSINNEENIKIELVELDDPDLNEMFDLSINMDSEGISDTFELPSNDKSKLCQMTFTVTEDQRDEIEKAMETARTLGAFVDTWNENKNGNSLARVSELFNGKDWD